MSKMIYIIFNAVINLKWALLLWHVMSLYSVALTFRFRSLKFIKLLFFG